MSSWTASDNNAEEPFLSPMRLTQLAFVLVLALVATRATMLELVRDPFEVSPGQAYTPLGPGPGATLVLNILCWIPAILVLLRRLIDPEYRLGSTWAALLWAALGVLAMASAAWTNDRYVTLISGSTLLSLGALAWAAGQTVRSWGRLRVVLALATGLLAVYAAQGIYYRQAELPLLQEQVERSKEQILRERGFQPDTFAAEQFLRRISGGEMIGFGSSPNTYAAVLVMLGIVAAGMLAQGIRDRRDPVLLAAPAIALLLAAWMLPYTRSTTALLTPLLGAALIAACWFGGDRIIRHRKRAFAAGVAVFLIGLAAVIGHGLYHGGLPGASMNFRWRYWTGAWALISDHPFRGVGYGNFGAWYLEYRVPAAAEEIRDPHNLFVRITAELGLLGLLLACLWLLRSAWEATRPLTADTHRGLSVGPIGLAAVVALATLLNVGLTIDFSADPAWIILEMFKRLMFAGVLVVIGALTLVASRTSAKGDDAPAPLALLAANVALAILLLHNLIDFSFFEPGPMALVALILGAVSGVRSVPEQSRLAARGLVRPLAAAGLAVATVAALTLALALARPVIAADWQARTADELLRTSARPENLGGGIAPDRAQLAAMTYEAAFRSLPWNADYAMKAARAWLTGRMSLVNIRDMMDAAIEADPRHVRYRLDRARLELLLAPADADLDRALSELQRATELNPTDVAVRLEYADTLHRLGQLDEAVRQWTIALAYDDRLDPTEPKRLSPDRREAVQRQIDRVTSQATP